MNKKIYKSFFAIRKARYVLSRKNLTLYYSLVYPYLAYGVTLWGSTYPAHLSRLIIRQKKVVRIIAGATMLMQPQYLEVSRYVFSYISGLLSPALSQLSWVSAGTT